MVWEFLPTTISVVTVVLSVLLDVKICSWVRLLPSDIQSSLLANFHGSDTFIPACSFVNVLFRSRLIQGIATLDHCANANLDNEGSSTDRGIESREMGVSRCSSKNWVSICNLLSALVIRLAGVLEVASVLN